MAKILSILVIVSLMFSGFALADSKLYFTKKNWAGCITEADLKLILDLQRQGDIEAMQKMLDQHRCFLVREDLPVYITENGFFFIRVRPKGQTLSLWMLREALK